MREVRTSACIVSRPCAGTRAPDQRRYYSSTNCALPCISANIRAQPCAGARSPDQPSPDVMPKRRNFEIVDRLQTTHPQFFCNPRAIYDGRHNLFAKQKIPPGDVSGHLATSAFQNTSLTYRVAIGRRQPPTQTHSVTLKEVSVIKIEYVYPRCACT